MLKANFYKINILTRKPKIALGQNFILVAVPDYKTLNLLKKIVWIWAGSEGFFEKKRIFFQKIVDFSSFKYKFLLKELSLKESYLIKLPEPQNVWSFLQFWRKAKDFEFDDIFLEDNLYITFGENKSFGFFTRNGFSKIQVLFGVSNKLVISENVMEKVNGFEAVFKHNSFKFLLWRLGNLKWYLIFLFKFLFYIRIRLNFYRFIKK